MNDPYKFGKHPNEHPKKKRRRRIIWAIVLLLFLLAIVVTVIIILRQIKPETTINQAKAVTKKISFDEKTKHYDQDGFGIDLPATWSPAARPERSPYQTYSWRHSEKGTNGEEIQVFKDTIPANFAVNRVMIVTSQGDRLELQGGVSDNCSKFTKGLNPAPGQVGVPAKWLDVSFLCDQFNQQRDVIGTSSVDGVNTVVMTSPTTGAAHKFFFAYTNQDVTPDYTTFQNALQSFRMQ